MRTASCKPSIGAIIRRDLRTLSLLPCDSLRDNPCACVIKSTLERQLKLNEIAWGGLSTKKYGGYKNSPPYVTARWPPQQISPLNFLGNSTIEDFHVTSYQANNFCKSSYLRPPCSVRPQHIHFWNPYDKTNNLTLFSEKSEHVSIFDPCGILKVNGGHHGNATICGISI